MILEDEDFPFFVNSEPIMAGAPVPIHIGEGFSRDSEVKHPRFDEDGEDYGLSAPGDGCWGFHDVSKVTDDRRKRGRVMTPLTSTSQVGRMERFPEYPSISWYRRHSVWRGHMMPKQGWPRRWVMIFPPLSRWASLPKGRFHLPPGYPEGVGECHPKLPRWGIARGGR